MGTTWTVPGGVIALAMGSGCGLDAFQDVGETEPASFAASPPVLRILTPWQYRNAVRDLFGPVEVTTVLSSAGDIEGSHERAAATATVQETAAREFERAAYEVASALFSDDVLRADLDLCVPESSVDPCMASFFETVIARAWRRPLADEEVQALLDLAATVGESLDDPDRGFEVAVAGALQSPHFLYRQEFGEAGGSQETAFTSLEMASRLSFALWNSVPDQTLFEAGVAGELATAQGVRAHAQRMLDDPRADVPLSDYLAKRFHVDGLSTIQKDADLFPYWTPALAHDAEVEAWEMIADHVQPGVDFRTLFTTQRTWATADVAAVYGVTTGSAPGEAALIQWPAYTGRRGLMGTIAWMSRHAGADYASAITRGHSVRHQFLCQEIVFPENIDDLIAAEKERRANEPESEVDVTGMTDARAESANRLQSPVCSTCHQLMEPIGLALENFDATGAYRAHEGKIEIDPSGSIDGEDFSGLGEMAALLMARPETMDCTAAQLYAHLQGRDVVDGDLPVVAELQASFHTSNYAIRDLVLDIVASDGFRYTAGSTAGSEE